MMRRNVGMVFRTMRKPRKSNKKIRRSSTLMMTNLTTGDKPGPKPKDDEPLNSEYQGDSGLNTSDSAGSKNDPKEIVEPEEDAGVVLNNTVSTETVPESTKTNQDEELLSKEQVKLIVHLIVVVDLRTNARDSQLKTLYDLIGILVPKFRLNLIHDDQGLTWQEPKVQLPPLAHTINIKKSM